MGRWSSPSIVWKFLCIVAVFSVDERSGHLRRDVLSASEPGPKTKKLSAPADAASQGAGSSMAVDNDFSIIIGGSKSDGEKKDDEGKEDEDKKEEEKSDEEKSGDETKKCGDAEPPSARSCRHWAKTRQCTENADYMELCCKEQCEKFASEMASTTSSPPTPIVDPIRPGREGVREPPAPSAGGTLGKTGLPKAPPGAVPPGMPQAGPNPDPAGPDEVDDMGDAVPQAVGRGPTGSGGVTGSSYCTWSPDYNCYTEGVPSCCLTGRSSCPSERPVCEKSGSGTGSGSGAVPTPSIDPMRPIPKAIALPPGAGSGSGSGYGGPAAPRDLPEIPGHMPRTTPSTVGGCATTRFGCCPPPNERMGKLDAAGSNCAPAPPPPDSAEMSEAEKQAKAEAQAREAEEAMKMEEGMKAAAAAAKAEADDDLADPGASGYRPGESPPAGAEPAGAPLPPEAAEGGPPRHTAPDASSHRGADGAGHDTADADAPPPADAADLPPPDPPEGGVPGES